MHSPLDDDQDQGHRKRPPGVFRIVNYSTAYLTKSLDNVKFWGIVVSPIGILEAANHKNENFSQEREMQTK